VSRSRATLPLLCAALGLGALPAAAPAAGPHADPEIKAMRLWSTGHGDPGPDYFVRVHLRLRVCAVRGAMKVRVHETLRIGGNTFGDHRRTLGYRQSAHCQRRTFKWRLRDEFLGVGTYRVAANVRDHDGQVAETRSRQLVTID
jgi:hypothetical protein